MTTRHLRLLGPLHLSTADARSLPISTRKEEALLTFLAVEQQQIHSRESLVGLLWPDAPDDKARLSVRVALSHLRSLLEAGDTRPFFRTTKNDVQFMADSCWLDVAEFTQALRSVDGHGHRADELCERCQPAVAQAVALYRGTFLEGFYLDDCQLFTEWLFMQRERFRMQVLGALGKLAAYALRQGQPEAALTYANRQLEIDPLHEDAHHTLMRVYVAQGRRAEALRQYELCRAALLEELGVEPALETRQLFEQLLSGGRPAAPAPPVPAADSSLPSRLPTYFTSFIGRQDELTQLTTALHSGHARLITLVGAGGMGKTRLAIEAAGQQHPHFANGIHFVPFASVRNPNDATSAVVDTLAAALGVTFRAGERTPQMQLLDWLRPRHTLLVLDNLEHLLACAPFLLEILQAAPQVHLLVTSREALGLQAEDVIRVAGLTVSNSDDVDAVGRSPAARLFIERAYRMDKRFHLQTANAADVAELCRLLEGRPLGLELAATHTVYRSCRAIAAAIRSDLDFLVAEFGDLPVRHRSLRAVFEQSWQTLTAGEQSCFARLSLFRNPFSVEATIAVAGASVPVLTRLLNAHLIMRYDDERFQIHDLLRQFAADKLTRSLPDPVALQRRHAEYFLTWLRRQDEILKGIQPRRSAEAIQAVLDDVGVAWAWAATTGAVETLTRALPVLAAFYALRGMHNTGERVFGATLTQIPAEEAALRAQLLVRLGSVLERQGKMEGATAALNEGIVLAAQHQDLDSLSLGKLMLARIDVATGSVPRAMETLKSALATLPGDALPALRAELLIYLGTLQSQQGDGSAVATYQEARRIIQRIGNKVQEQRLLLYQGIYVIGENEVAARHLIEQALALCPDTGDRTLESRILNALGYLAARRGDYTQAVDYHLRGLAIVAADQEAIQQSHALHNLCVDFYGLGDYSQAYRYGMESLAVAEANDLLDGIGYAQLHLGHVLAEMGRLSEAHYALSAAHTAFAKLERPIYAAEACVGLAYVERLRGNLSAALAHVETAYPTVASPQIEGMDEPARVYLHCYQVLAACHDPRAQEILGAAHRYIQSRAARLDPEDRERFLSAVPANRAILAAWEVVRSA